MTQVRNLEDYKVLVRHLLETLPSYGHLKHGEADGKECTQKQAEELKQIVDEICKEEIEWIERNN